MTQAASPSIPPGLVVELSRGKVLPGASAEADRWMAMLNDRLEECVATLDRERMAIEIIFRLKENGDDYLFWVSVHGADGEGLDPENPLDQAHIDQAKRTKEPGWTEAEPQLLLADEHTHAAVAGGDAARSGLGRFDAVHARHTESMTITSGRAARSRIAASDPPAMVRSETGIEEEGLWAPGSV